MMQNEKRFPRIMICAGSSGSGKTLLTCGLLQVFQEAGLKTASFKCGPDYIDPMFHRRVIGTKSGNLDTFFTSEERTRALFAKNAAGSDVSVLEGVMGYYDGLGGVSTRASAYDVARVTDTPAILVVGSRGMSLSLAAFVKGFASFREDSRIRGVIFNQMSPMLYPRIRKAVEESTGIPCLGYVPVLQEAGLESRHLGLVLPGEIPSFRKKIQRIAGELRQSLEIDKILRLADGAPALGPEEELLPRWHSSRPLRIGVARDEAFCFIYEDNLELLEQMGAETVFFSPIRDAHLPENLDGLLLYGGYPELHAKELSENRTMRMEIARAIREGLPCMAECGGFLYLHRELEDMEKRLWPMAGVIPAKAFKTPKLSRFGYIILRPEKEIFGQAGPWELPAHEFHYYESEICGQDCTASRPSGGKDWKCMHLTPTLMAGFPHLYYYGCPALPEAFLKRCERRGNPAAEESRILFSAAPAAESAKSSSENNMSD